MKKKKINDDPYIRTRRLLISLTEAENKALYDLANFMRRQPRDQAAVLVREGLIQYGMISWVPTMGRPLALGEDSSGNSGNLGNQAQTEDLSNDS